MLNQIVFLGEHSSAESTLKLFYLHMDFTNMLIMISYLWECFSATMTANILFFFGMSSYMIIKFAKTWHHSFAGTYLALEQSEFSKPFSDHIKMVYPKISVVWNRARKSALGRNEIFPFYHLNFVIRFDIELSLHFLNSFLRKYFF